MDFKKSPSGSCFWKANRQNVDELSSPVLTVISAFPVQGWSTSMRILKWILVAVGLYVGSAYVRAFIAEGEAAKESERLLKEIARSWVPEDFLTRCSGALKASPREPVLQVLASARNLLGPIVSISGETKCSLKSGVSEFDRLKHTYAHCSIQAAFEKRSATIVLRLMQDERAWQLDDMTINGS